jgi:hypothetical protein
VTDQLAKKKGGWPGRPPLKPRLDQHIQFQCASTEHAAWKEAAEKCGMPLHVWIRCIIDAAAGVSDIFVQLQRTQLEMYIRRAEHMREARQSRKKDA